MFLFNFALMLQGLDTLKLRLKEDAFAQLAADAQRQTSEMMVLAGNLTNLQDTVQVGGG